MHAAHYDDKRDASLSRGAVNVCYLFRRSEYVISPLDRFIYWHVFVQYAFCALSLEWYFVNVVLRGGM